MMRTEFYAFQRLSATARPKAFAGIKPSLMVDHVFEANWPIVKVPPSIGIMDANREASPVEIHLPVNAACVAPPQFDGIAGADGCESDLP